MFKAYYKGELASEQEFKTKGEAKKAIAPLLAGQLGKTTDEILKERDENGAHSFQIEGDYDRTAYYQLRPRNIARVCPICGKTFYVSSEKCKQKVCSEACRKIHLRNYNNQYHKDLFKRDEAKHQKALACNRLANKKNLAKKKWERRLAFADAILKLAQYEDARELIATYLDLKVISQGRKVKDGKPFRTQAEIDAERKYIDVITDSLGD